MNIIMVNYLLLIILLIVGCLDYREKPSYSLNINENTSNSSVKENLEIEIYQNNTSNLEAVKRCEIILEYNKSDGYINYLNIIEETYGDILKQELSFNDIKIVYMMKPLEYKDSELNVQIDSAYISNGNKISCKSENMSINIKDYNNLIKSIKISNNTEYSDYIIKQIKCEYVSLNSTTFKVC